MKKILLILFIFLITGCTYNEEINGDITEIKYNDLVLLENEYENIVKNLPLEFNNKNPKEEFTDKLTIKTKEDIYYYSLSDNYISINNHYSPSTLNKYLKELNEKYDDTNFYEITYGKNIDTNDSLSVTLDKTSNYIVIKLNNPIKNFKINEIEYKDGVYKDIDLLYNMDNIDDKTITIRKTINYSTPDIRISFENPYNYLISIIPNYNKNDEVHFETTYKRKN